MNALWDRALEAAAEARVLLREGHAPGVISRAYYAVFTAARALLIENASFDERQIRRHSAVHRFFSERFIKPGLMSVDLGRGLRHLFEERASIDYGGAAIDLEEAREATEFMERFIAAAEALRERRGEP